VYQFGIKDEINTYIHKKNNFAEVSKNLGRYISANNFVGSK